MTLHRNKLSQLSGDLFLTDGGLETTLVFHEGIELPGFAAFVLLETDDGELHERIYDVAVSDGRKTGRDGRCKKLVGSTVDIKNATYTNTIGDALMSAHWQDPDFDPSQHAFYYVRVLEIPTPCWTTYDAAFYGIERPDNVPATTHDRAYTSPVWYTP